MPTGLTDKQQTILTIIAYTLGSLGGITAAVGVIHSDQITLIAGIISVVAGAISFGIKEGLGISPQPVK